MKKVVTRRLLPLVLLLLFTINLPLMATAEEPFRITMYNSLMYTEPQSTDGPILSKIQEYTNTKLDITWSPGGAVYQEKLTTMIASGDLPMVVMAWENRSEAVVSAVRAGMFWDLTPYLDQFPNLARLNPMLYDNTNIDGKYFCLPRSRVLVEDGMVYRKDWLDKLGLEEPKTLDEFIALVRAFTTDDPDGNGVADTHGFVEYNDLRGFDLLLGWFGTANGWAEQDGKLIPSLFTKEYLDTLNFMRDMYAEGVLNQDFAIVNRNQRDEYMMQSKAGMYLAGIDQVMRLADLPKVDPAAVVDIWQRVESPIGMRQYSYKGFNGCFFFSKSGIKTEEELLRVLDFFDKVNDVEIQNLVAWGIEGRHYHLDENGLPARTEEENVRYGNEVFEITDEFLIHLPTDAIQVDDGTMQNKWRKMANDNAGLAVANPGLKYLSLSYLENSGTLDTIYKDARVQYILGQIDEDGWKEALEDWLYEGGQEYIDEINEQYLADPDR